ncbi:hypothetical protein [Bradyrhizobium prioriisuperbiae]|uniref:hypothetical protein n=1 Tax=Bradyrhizobium prioriisuperbiae TaxID=2854389 RepID=UPI0028E2D739|nr:hypothetical protein [Bradyrhizobium prioritasuperba]
MRVRIAAVLLGMLMLVSPALGQPAPSEDQQRQACLSDVMRLCVAHVPNRARIQSCLGQHHQELSPQCRTVYDASLRAQRAAPRSQE